MKFDDQIQIMTDLENSVSYFDEIRLPNSMSRIQKYQTEVLFDSEEKPWTLLFVKDSMMRSPLIQPSKQVAWINRLSNENDPANDFQKGNKKICENAKDTYVAHESFLQAECPNDATTLRRSQNF